jgi:NADH-quinone oxidoreductase subunit K
MMLDPRLFLSLAAVMFALGIYGVITRRNAVGILLSLELMANAVNINLVTFARYGAGAMGQAFALFSIGLTVAEVVVGLAIVVLLFRAHKDTLVALAQEFSS